MRHLNQSLGSFSPCRHPLYTLIAAMALALISGACSADDRVVDPETG